MESTIQKHNNLQESLLTFLYGTVIGRIILKPLVCPMVSRVCGTFLSSRYSRFLIQPFIRKNHIDMSQFQKQEYQSYNEFFSRKICPDARPVDMNPDNLISPCDSKLTVLPITMENRFTLKHTSYTVESLLKNKKIARRYDGGYALIFRLTVDDYHRYCYVSSGCKSRNVSIPGVLHTVNPIANDVYPIYKENVRQYCLLRSKEFGDIVVMEVGALLVGKIVNHHEKADVCRGQEKGYFQFGGSTIVLLIKKDTVQIKEEILENSRQGIETVVQYGACIGKRIE